MTDWYDDDRLTFAEADELVAEYIDAVGDQRTRTTTVDVLQWADVENRHHNRTRIYDALSAVCEPAEDNWAGRVVFDLTTIQ